MKNIIYNKYISKILTLSKPYKYRFMLAIFCMIIVAISEGLIPKIVKDLLDNGFSGQYKDKIWQIPVLIISLSLVRSLGQFGAQYYLSWVAQKISHILRNQMFNKVINARMHALNKYQVANLIHIIIFEVLQILSTLSGVLITLVRDSITLVCLLTYLIWINWQLALIVAIVLPPIAFLVSKVKRRLKNLNKLQHEFTTSIAYQVEQVFKNIRVVKAYNAQKLEAQKFKDLSSSIESFSMKISIAGGLNQPITQMLTSIALSIVIGIAIFQSNYSHNSVTVGDFTSFIMAMLLLISPLKRLSDIHQPLQRSLNSCEYVFALMDLPAEELILQSSYYNNNDIKYDIEIENLSICYTKEQKQSNTAALRDFNLYIPANQYTAIVGSSGSGKSTLLEVLLGFIEINHSTHDITHFNSGKILIAGQDISTINAYALREQIAYIGQNIFLFNRSIAENIAYGCDIEHIDLDKLHKAIDQAHLSEYVNGLTQGIHSIIGDNGGHLSGGQRQRLSIARALYRNSPILLLDEATSALDAKSEEQIQQTIASLVGGKTIISVAHRLHTIINADNIVVLDSGKIVEQGTHDELLKNKSYYATLYNMNNSQK
jgi:ATP-binding cassette, subfamily B, bacterial MsbA